LSSRKDSISIKRLQNPSKGNSTELSKQACKLKDDEKEYTIEWNILRKTRPYSNKTKRWQLCNLGKVFIIRRPELKQK
jgi:hypothetical protein